MDVYIHLQAFFSKQTMFPRQVVISYSHYSSIYDNYIILRGFNMEPSNSLLNAFMKLTTCLI